MFDKEKTGTTYYLFGQFFKIKPEIYKSVFWLELSNTVSLTWNLSN